MPYQPIIFASLTRISDLQTRPFQVAAAERTRWATGDYVVRKLAGTTALNLLDPRSHAELDRLLSRQLGLG
jgi:hypothetical protein